MTTQQLEERYQVLLRVYISQLAKAITHIKPEKAKLFEITQGLKLVAQQRNTLAKTAADPPPAVAVPFKIRLYNPPQREAS